MNRTREELVMLLPGFQRMLEAIQLGFKPEILESVPTRAQRKWVLLGYNECVLRVLEALGHLNIETKEPWSYRDDLGLVFDREITMLLK